ncbi:MAG: hypothetical protein SGJ20_18335 [Planctomycetota bacterium]|nr:hypothetical protein [Planctomycetota bacterium]
MTVYDEKLQHRDSMQRANVRLATGMTFLAWFALMASLYLVFQTSFEKLFVIGPLGAIFGYLAVESLLQRLSPKYRQQSMEVQQVDLELERIRASMKRIHAYYPRRPKRKQFKLAFELKGLRIRNFEERLATAMLLEVKEVFVMAFCVRGVVVHVTASIGSWSHCRPSDNPLNWEKIARKWGCDELRQYHNHPTTSGTTEPSPADHRFVKSARKFFGEYREFLRSFIIFWNTAHEWKVLEYTDSPEENKLVFEFDATKDKHSDSRTAQWL